MTFQPVLPAALLVAIAVVVVALRLLTMRRLHSTAGARWTTVWRWSGLTLAVLLILIAAARPGVEHGERGAAAAARSAQNTNVFLVVDRSADSAVEDYGDRQSRMSAIRSDIEALIDRYPQARFALIAAGQQYPDSKSLVFYFGSGAAGSRAPQGEFDPTAGSVDGGAVYGYGAGKDEPGLRRIAEQLGVPYVDRDKAGPIAESAPEGAGPQAERATTATGVAGRTELYWVFTLLAAVLLLFELFASIRDVRRTRLARRDVAL
jgi:hypothetical protein